MPVEEQQVVLQSRRCRKSGSGIQELEGQSRSSYCCTFLARVQSNESIMQHKFLFNRLRHPQEGIDAYVLDLGTRLQHHDSEAVALQQLEVEVLLMSAAKQRPLISC